MDQFVFTNKAKTVLGSFMGLGILCLVLAWFSGGDDHHTRFWSNLLHNSVFFTGIAFMAVFFIAVCITAYAGWHTLFKRIWEAFGSFLIPGFILMTIIGLTVYFHMNHIYHWADPSVVDPNSEHFDEILYGKSGFLNINWYLFGTIIIVGLWVFFFYKLRSLSIQEDTEGQGSDFAVHRKMRVYAAAFLPIAGFSSAAIIWQWVMSIDSHWYSTLFAWYSAASWFVSMIAMTIMIILYLKGKGYYQNVTQEHIHDLGKFLFAFSIFWTYLWFSQYMLIWYANVGEETGYFLHRMKEYPVLFYGNLVINFLVPFFVLMRNDTKRKFGSVGFVSGVVFLGHWWDYYLMIKPGIITTAKEAAGHHGGEAMSHAGDHGHEAAAHAAHHASEFMLGYNFPGLIELGTMLGFGAFFLFVVFTALGKASLVPKNDPYLEESLHHHV